MDKQKKNGVLVIVVLACSVSLILMIGFIISDRDRTDIDSAPPVEPVLASPPQPAVARERLPAAKVSFPAEEVLGVREDIAVQAPTEWKATLAPAHADLDDQDDPIILGEIDLAVELEGEYADLTPAGFAEQIEALLATAMADELRRHANNMLAEDGDLLRAFGAALLASLHELEYGHIEQVVTGDPKAALVLSGWLSQQALFEYQSLIWQAFDQNVQHDELHQLLLANEAGESGSRVLLDYMISRDERGDNAELYRTLAESETSPTAIRQKSAAALTLHESPRELHQYFNELSDNLAEDDPFRAHALRLAIEYEGPESAYLTEPYLTLDRVDGFMARDYEGNWEDLAVRVEQVATVPDAFVESGVVPRLFAHINEFGDYPPDADGQAIDRILNQIGKLIELGGDAESGDELEEELIGE